MRIPDSEVFLKSAQENARRAEDMWEHVFEGQVWESDDFLHWNPKKAPRGVRRAFLYYFGAVGAVAAGLVIFALVRSL